MYAQLLFHTETETKTNFRNQELFSNTTKMLAGNETNSLKRRSF